MTVLDRIKELAKNRGKSVKDVALDLELGENSLYRYDKQTPNGQTLQALADYFKVSTDYLLGRTDDKGSTVSEPVDLLKVVNSDEPNWDEWLSAGGKPLTDHDKELIKAIFYDRKNG